MECVKCFYFESIKNDQLSGSSHPLRNSKLSTLVSWNISKAREKYPELDIKDAIATAQRRLEKVSDADEIETILSENPYTRYLACALLAWQELGHSNGDSLCRFIENEKFEEECASKLESKSVPLKTESASRISRELTLAKAVETSSIFSNEMGPVIKLPVETKIVMRVGGAPTCCPGVNKKSNAPERNNMECGPTGCQSALKKSKEPERTNMECGPIGCQSVSKKSKEPERNKMECGPKSCQTAPMKSMEPERNIMECGPKSCQTAQMKSKEPERNIMECGPKRCPVIVTKIKVPDKKIMDKIDKACCLDSKCSEHLLAMDKSIKDLKMRVMLLARREANRIELIKRGEEAWRDLEMGYNRRLRNAQEKELDLLNQIERGVAERNSHRNDCTKLAEQLKAMGKRSEADNARLNATEKELYNLACERVKLSQQCAKGEAVVAERACKAAQLDRDLQFKEEQARRKLQTLKTEVDSACAITHETERALRGELGAIRDQLAEVSKQLLAQDSEAEKVKLIIEELRQEKMEMIEDLEGCKEMCDSRVQGLVDEIKSKSEKLAELKEKVLDCRCKIPVDANVEVRRTPSFAALCNCTSADKMKTSCSCTSLRGRLMTDVLATLFGGLQAEMGTTVTQMSCELLKCLEDKHNWDRVTVVKTNLKAYFSKLLAGELDIAIATSIENYHAKWVGLSCADSSTPETKEAEIERRAKSLASQLAEQLFQEKSNELEKRAKDLLASGPPPCNCKPTTIGSAPVQSRALPCMVKNRPASRALSSSATPIFWHHVIQDDTQQCQHVEDLRKPKAKPPEWYEEDKRREGHWKKNASGNLSLNADVKVNDAKVSKVAASHAVAFPFLAKNKLPTNVAAGSASPIYWHQAMLDVTQLRRQVEGLQKDTLKKEDLKAMEDKFSKIIYHASGSRSQTGTRTDYLNGGNVCNKVIKKVQKTSRAVNNSGLPIFENKPTTTKRNNIDTRFQIKKRSNSFDRNGIDKTFTTKRNENTYAVNMCLCNAKNHQRISKDTVSQRPSTKKTKSKPINTNYISQNISKRSSKESDGQSCPSNCVCFNKIPSNTSIDKLLQTLAKWKYDLDASCNDKLFTRKTSDDDNVSLNSETIKKYREKSQEKTATKQQESLSDQEIKPLNTSKTSKFSEKIGQMQNLNI